MSNLPGTKDQKSQAILQGGVQIDAAPQNTCHRNGLRMRAWH